MIDMVIKNANIIDGTNRKAYCGNVGVLNGKIVLDNVPEEAKLVIDGEGKYVAPGFIDSHSHGDLIMGEHFAYVCSTNQGITTQIAGQCGMSMGPVDPKRLEELQSFLNAGTAKYPKEMEEWVTWSKYLEYADKLPKTTNYKLLVGFNTLRITVMGYDDRKPTAKELEQMKVLLKDAMEHGALGMSSGLAYVPGTSADVDELVALAEVMQPYGGVYATHMRNESFDLIKSVEEAIEVGRRANVAVNISHHKAMGRRNWGLQKKSLALIEQARAEGIKVTCDQYPYNCSMTHLYPCLPPWYFVDGVDGMVELLKDPKVREKARHEMDDPNTSYENLYLNAGGWDGIMVCSTARTPEAEGLTVSEYAKKIGKDPFDAFFDLMIENNGVAGAVYHSIGDEDIYDIIRAPFTTVGSDALVRTAEEKGHPRGYGTMPHAICAFAKDKPIMPLEEVIWKMTGLPAEIYSLANKGVIRHGYDADLVIFDYEKLRDGATYIEPCELTDGINYVIVDGEIVCQDKVLTGTTPGRILRHYTV